MKTLTKKIMTVALIVAFASSPAHARWWGGGYSTPADDHSCPTSAC